MTLTDFSKLPTEELLNIYRELEKKIVLMELCTEEEVENFSIISDILEERSNGTFNRRAN